MTETLHSVRDADRALNERVANTARNRQAMGLAIRDALLQHHRAGNPIAVWRDGQVVWIPPEDIPAELERAAAAEQPLAPQAPGATRP
jgi:hypothetical protein